MIHPVYFIMLSLVLFFIGVFGIFLRRNLLVIFMCIELMLNSVNLAFITFSRMLHNMEGQLVVFFVIAVAAAEAAVGLAIILLVSRNRKTVEIDRLTTMKG
jgi:NADH-quinone oxidoreductase subunit K